ncbi:MAG: helix-turn-helix transcriptional regulator [Pyrinomonadaceae bacterium]|nr:helix-turn-helix transcriptional regulator [Pyrinomonadaceae bacterium]
MTLEQKILESRKERGWEQIETAKKLGISQTYLSLLETGKRPISKQIARKAIKVLGLSAEVLPFEISLDNLIPAQNDVLAKQLGSLGYPPFAYLKSKQKKNPAEVLLSALKSDNLEIRVVEALPWIVFNFPQMDWQTVIKIAKINDLQNRLGFVVNLAENLAIKSKDYDTLNLLREKKLELAKSRLLREESLCHNSITEVEKKWLKNNRSKEAKFWRLLTDLEIKHLNYA